jgi:GTP-binding protein HflX
VELLRQTLAEHALAKAESRRKALDEAARLAQSVFSY